MTLASLMVIKGNSVLLLWLAKKIKELRTERRLTQLQCFHDTNIHIGRIEQGKRDVSFTTLYNICNYFNITLEEFFKDFEEELNK